MAGLLLTAIAGTDFAFYLMLAILLLSVICSFAYKKDNKTAVVTGLLCLSAGMLSYMAVYTTNVIPIQALENHKVNITATVVEKPYVVDSKYYYVLETTSVTPLGEKLECPQKMRLKISATDGNNGRIIGAEKYDSVQLNVQLTKPLNSPYALHNISLGYYLNARIIDGETMVKPQTNKPWYSFLDDIHSSITTKIKEYVKGDSGDLLNVLLLGDKSQLDNSIEQQFREAGISHIIVVSGLHLSIISSSVFLFLNLLSRRKKTSAVVTIFVIVFYMCLTGFSYSVVRSAIMNIIYMLSFFIYKKPQAVNSLGFAGLVITLINPLSIGNLSLLMSFTATLGITTLGEVLLSNVVEKLPDFITQGRGKPLGIVVKYIAECIIISLSATLFTLPIMVFIFQQFSLYFILSNLLITAIAPVTIMSGCALVLLSYIPFINVLASIPAFIAYFSCNFMLWTSSYISKLPYAVINLDGIFIKIAMIVVLIVITAFFIAQGFKIKNIYSCLAMATSSAIMVLTLGVLLMSNTVCLQVLNTGYGVTITEKNLFGINVLTSGGSNYHLYSTINSLENNKVNSLLIPNSDKYYSRYSMDILENICVDEILVGSCNSYSSELINVLENKNYKQLTSNATIQYSNYSVTLFNCSEKQWINININNSNILIAPNYADCSLLPSEYTQCNIFIAPSNCKNIDYIKCENVVFCGTNKNKDNNYIYTSKGDVTIYKFLDGRFHLWQS